MHLFKLPHDIVNYILSQWLRAEDIARLDSSCTSSTSRKLLSDEISCKEFVLCERFISSSVFLSYYQWIIKKNIKINKISFIDPQFEVSEISNLESVLLHVEEFALSLMDEESNHDNQALLNSLKVASNLKIISVASLDYHHVDELFIIFDTLPCKEKLMNVTFIEIEVVNIPFLDLLSASCPNISTLYIGVCPVLGEIDYPVNCNFTSLKEFTVNSCKNMDDIALKRIIYNSYNLDDVWLANYYFTAETSNVLVPHCVKLTSLILDDAWGHSAGDAAELLKRCPNLRELTFNCGDNINIVLQAVVSTKLTLIALSNENSVYLLTNDMIIAFLSKCVLLTSCSIDIPLDDNFIAVVIKMCPSISVFKLSISRFSQDAVVQLVQSYKLRGLDITRCFLTSDTILEIAANGNYLQRLSVGCESLNTIWLDCIKDNFRWLNELYITVLKVPGTPEIDCKVEDVLWASRPGLSGWISSHEYY